MINEDGVDPAQSFPFRNLESGRLEENNKMCKSQTNIYTRQGIKRKFTRFTGRNLCIGQLLEIIC